MDFSIEALEASSRITFSVDVGRRDDGSAVGFVVVGPNSEEYTRAEREIQLLTVREAARRGEPTNLDTAEGAAQVAEGADRRRDAILRHCVVGWHGFTIGESAAADFTPENVARVLKARPHWARRLLAAINDEGNFTAG